MSATDGYEVAVVSEGYFIVFYEQLLFRDTMVKAESKTPYMVVCHSRSCQFM